MAVDYCVIWMVVWMCIFWIRKKRKRVDKCIKPVEESYKNKPSPVLILECCRQDTRNTPFGEKSQLSK